MKLRISWAVFLVLGIGILVLPLPWLLGGLLAGTVHELGHLLALILWGGDIRMLEVHPFGARIQADIPQRLPAMLCALAGPSAGLLLLPLAQQFPTLSLCALAQSLYNLLPLPGLDGGTVVHILTQNRPKLANSIFLLTRILLTGALVALACLDGSYRQAFFVLFWGLVRLFLGKSSCKPAVFAVQ